MAYLHKGMSARYKIYKNEHATAPVLTVPQNKVWCLNAACLTTTAAAGNGIYITAGGSATLYVWLAPQDYLATTLTLIAWSGEVWLEAGDTVQGVSNTAGYLSVAVQEFDAEK